MIVSAEAFKKDWHPEFTPSFTPEEMLKLGVFEGKYINIIKGIPASWKKLPKVVGPNDPPGVELKTYKVKSRQPLSVWKENGWIMTDKGGWFHWYCLYYLGRRLGKWGWDSITAFTDKTRKKNPSRIIKLTGTSVPEVSNEQLVPPAFNRT